MDNRDLLLFLLNSIKNHPNDQELGKYIRTHTHRFLGEFEKENEEIDILTDEELALLVSLKNIR